MKKSICAAALIPLMLLMACKETPAEEIVINKNDGRLENIIMATAEPAATYEFPESWSEAFQGYSDNLSVEVKAEVQGPVSETNAVYEVAPQEVTDQQADACLSAMIGDAVIYEASEQLSKSDIEKLIEAAQWELSSPESDLNALLGDPGQEEEYERSKAAVEEALQALTEQWRSAPDSVAHKTVERRFVPVNDYARKIQGTAMLPDGTSAYLNLRKDNNCIDQSIVIHTPKAQLGLPELFSGATTDLNGLSIDLRAAEALAADALESMGLNGQFRLSFAGSAVTHTPESKTPDEAPKCFMLYYSRMVEEEPVLYCDQSGRQLLPFGATWPHETLIFGVNDSGVIYFEWVSPIQITGVLNENAALLPFEEIMSRFRQNIAFSYCPINTIGNVDQYRLSITSIRFGYTRVAMPDEIAKAYLVPTWCFYGVEQDYYSDPGKTQYKLDGNNCYTQDIPGHCVLTLNALDGSVIDRSLGY